MSSQVLNLPCCFFPAKAIRWQDSSLDTAFVLLRRRFDADGVEGISTITFLGGESAMATHGYPIRLDLTIVAKNEHAVLLQLAELAQRWAQMGLEQNIKGSGRHCEY